MGEVKGLSGGEMWTDHRPQYALGGIRYQVLDDGTAGGSFLNGEQCPARNKSVSNGPVPVCPELRGLADNHINAVVTHVHGLCRSLNPVTDDGNNLILKCLVCF